MHYSKRGLLLTKQFEGRRLVAYQDAVGVWTIAYGHTLGVHEGMTCTPEQADTWLLEDIAMCEVAVETYAIVPLTQGEFDALVDFAFNLGDGALEHSTLLKLVNTHDFADAANEFEKWDHAGGKVIAQLLRRRLAEKELFQEADSGQ